MKEGARWSIGTAVIVLTLFGAVLQGDSLQTTPTTFGNAPAGFGAVHELLRELQLSAGRSYARAENLPTGVTIWWIEPNGLCHGVEAEALETGRSGVWNALSWLRAGGTGVLWLPARSLPCLASATLAGLSLPIRAIDVAKELEDVGDAETAEADETPPNHALSGSLTRRERSLGEVPLRFFEDVRGWEVIAAERDGSPFAVAQRFGSGRLVVIADAAPLRNRWLDHSSAAPLAVDVAIALGGPSFDEREHGILPTENPFLYLAKSAALPLFLGAVILAVLLIWSVAAIPQASLAEIEDESPTLEAFIDSLSTLYASTRDHGRVLARYQEFTLSQLRRVLRLPPETSFHEVQLRFTRRYGITAEQLLALTESDPCRGRAALRERAAKLDALVEEAAR